ncbi:MAG: 2-phosphosulfolactate phosphatase [Cryobacterium sp.]
MTENLSDPAPLPNRAAGPDAVPADAAPQQQYQVRLDWGIAGFQALAGGADVVILVDALPAVAADLSLQTPLGVHRVVSCSLANRTAVAEWVLARQTETGQRCSVAVIAVGERRDDGTLRFAVEDSLAAGAVVDALSSLGLDHCSPEAAAASVAFEGLARAVRHLVGACETGQLLLAQNRRAEVQALSAIDTCTTVTELAHFAFPA